MLTSRVLAAAKVTQGISRCELDSHADTCAFGKHCFVISTSSQQVSVSGFHPDLKSISNVRIGTAAIAYDCVSTQTTYILFFHQVLLLPNMEVNLLCPDQLREFGIQVKDVPLLRIPAKNRTTLDHSIYDSSTLLHIPLKYNKPISYFECRKPTRQEIDDAINNVHVQMTSELEWCPYDPVAASDELQIRESLKEIMSLCSKSSSVFSMTSERSLLSSVHASQDLLSLTLLDNRVLATLAGVVSGD